MYLFFFQVGDPKDQVRNSIRAILRSLRNVYPVIIFNFYEEFFKPLSFNSER
jgi:hypothetical protein